MFIYLGFLFVFGFLAYSVWDLERKRERIVQMVKRLEPLAQGEHANQLAYLRRLCRSSFFARNLRRSLETELVALEQANGIKSEDEGRSVLPSANKWIRSMEERVTQVEKSVAGK